MATEESTHQSNGDSQENDNGNALQEDETNQMNQPQVDNSSNNNKSRPVISSTSCRQLVAGNYDVILNDSTSLRSILLDYLEQFKQHEFALGQQNCLYSNEFKLLKEFSKTLKEDRSNLEYGEQDYNQRKNRYKDIIPFNHTRVVLSNEPNSQDPGSNYINANYIRGPSGLSRAYIACQGPLESTLIDFWRMIWECNVSVIIMACNEYESGKPKCEIYWPLQIDSSQVYGKIQVTLLREREICSDFLIRKFSVKLMEPILPETMQQQQQQVSSNEATIMDNSSSSCSNSSSSSSANSNNSDCGNGNPKRNNNNISDCQDNLSRSKINKCNNNNQQLSSKLNDHVNLAAKKEYMNHNRAEPSRPLNNQYKIVSERTICQFHYTTWPDHGVPDSVHPILELVRLVREVQPAEDRPILVHCSAGCGRTGTICCIDYVWGLLRRDKLDSSFNLCNIISDMRQQRMAMVQTLEQYILCHRTVAALFMQQLDYMDDACLNDNLDSIEDEDDKVFDEQDIGPVFI